MTCIVAIVDEKGIAHFAGDSLVVTVPSEFHSGVSQSVRVEPKVWARDGMLFGANGKVRMLQLLRYRMKIPECPDGWDRVHYLVSSFIPELQACFRENEYPSDSLSGNILLSLGTGLFVIGETFSVRDMTDNYDSVGKASEIALGSLHTTAQLDMTPQQRLYLALKAAERHTCVVSEPFTYISSEMDEAEILDGRFSHEP